MLRMKEELQPPEEHTLRSLETDKVSVATLLSDTYIGGGGGLNVFRSRGKLVR